MPHQFDNQDAPQNTPALRSQRMTADEAKAVIDLWQRERDEQTGLTDRPAVPDVAEGLNIGTEDVQRLLGEVRERRAEEERALAYEQELAEIRRAEDERRLAEEERKLAEVRRQRAELRREQAEPWQEPVYPQQPKPRRETISYPKPEYFSYRSRTSRNDSTIDGSSFLIAIGLAITLLIGILACSQQHATSNGCVLTTPDGRSQPCGPEYEQAHPESRP